MKQVEAISCSFQTPYFRILVNFHAYLQLVVSPQGMETCCGCRWWQSTQIQYTKLLCILWSIYQFLNLTEFKETSDVTPIYRNQKLLARLRPYVLLLEQLDSFFRCQYFFTVDTNFIFTMLYNPEVLSQSRIEWSNNIIFETSAHMNGSRKIRNDYLFLVFGIKPFDAHQRIQSIQ